MVIAVCGCFEPTCSDRGGRRGVHPRLFGKAQLLLQRRSHRTWLPHLPVPLVQGVPQDDDMAVTVVIPAHNEADRIAAVLEPVTKADVGPVIVVADRCSDATVTIASRFGVLVVPIISGTKGTGMAVGANLADTSTVLYVDADIKGLKPSQVVALATEPPAGGMVVGVRGKVNGGRLPGLLAAWPSISGERRLPTAFVRSLHLTGKGWRAETIINAEVARRGIPHRQIILHGVSNTKAKGFGGWASEALRVFGVTVLYAPELGRYVWTEEP